MEKALSSPEKKLPVTMLFTGREGQSPRLVMTDVRANETAEVIADHVIERARKTPTDASRIAENLSRLGDTPFSPGLTGIDVEIDDDIMMPVSIVNRMRREAADELMAKRAEAVILSRAPKLTRAELDVAESGEMLGAVVLDTEEFADRLDTQKLRPVPLEHFMQGSSEGQIPYILNISKGKLDDYIRGNFDEIVGAVKDTGILIGNLGWIQKFRDAGVRVYGDYGLNVYNEQARRAFQDAGVEIYMPSHETGISDNRRIPLMITEHMVQAEYLTDRKGEDHIIATSPSGDKTLIY